VQKIFESDSNITPCGEKGEKRLDCFIIRQCLSEEMHFPTCFQILINQNCDLQGNPVHTLFWHLLWAFILSRVFVL
jgi:hypothetical protein